jgi:hypothetical protein
MYINGIYCHECGCPNSHLDAKGIPYKVKCRWCGNEFIPEAHEDCCTEDCAQAYHGGYFILEGQDNGC